MEHNPVVMNSSGVMTWCKVSTERIISLYFFENRSSTGESYQNLLIHYAFSGFRVLRDDYIVQQDGASPHVSDRMKAYLNTKLPDRWTERGGPVLWPLRSSDVTPCDFFSWGHTKSKICSTSIDSVEEPKRRIRAEIHSTRQGTLKQAWDNKKLRRNYIKQVSGNISKTLWTNKISTCYCVVGSKYVSENLKNLDETIQYTSRGFFGTPSTTLCKS